MFFTFLFISWICTKRKSVIFRFTRSEDFIDSCFSNGMVFFTLDLFGCANLSITLIGNSRQAKRERSLPKKRAKCLKQVGEAAKVETLIKRQTSIWSQFEKQFKLQDHEATIKWSSKGEVQLGDTCSKFREKH